ncbi:hypothetical protein HS088_TW23G00384 [Tripterygium wilfordii]|uniref:Tryptophan aminotransferase-related protein 4-like n=1 Tax=Tripterygium wilfordii TaxID=458696 RepID=A0A7J7BVK7_TRIWF|nr:hypothetical protein HS088_TW23G00384 [Tripterygium wilfordii]
MDKNLSSKYMVCLVTSIILNILAIINVYVGDGWDLSWTKRAATEAEAVAAIYCSGHGRAYMDGLVLDGNLPVCECNSCYGGPDCSQFNPTCIADADGGDPYFLEPFWMQNAASSALVVAGWHRMGYTYHDKSFISAELERHIRKLHAIVGNAVTDGRRILFGAGSSQLLIAAVYALSPVNSSSPAARVVVSTPYYQLYKMQAEVFNSVEFKWAMVKDRAVYERMVQYMQINTMGVSRDSQLRTLKLLRVVLEREARDLFDFGYKTMSSRWETLSKTISMSKRFSLQEIRPENCTYFDRIREASPGYAWLKCERNEEKNCYRVLKAGNITGRAGKVFGAEDRYVRLSLLRSQDDFDVMLHHLNKLVLEEGGSKTM